MRLRDRLRESAKNGDRIPGRGTQAQVGDFVQPKTAADGSVLELEQAPSRVEARKTRLKQEKARRSLRNIEKLLLFVEGSSHVTDAWVSVRKELNLLNAALDGVCRRCGEPAVVCSARTGRRETAAYRGTDWPPMCLACCYWLKGQL